MPENIPDNQEEDIFVDYNLIFHALIIGAIIAAFTLPALRIIHIQRNNRKDIAEKAKIEQIKAEKAKTIPK